MNYESPTDGLVVAAHHDDDGDVVVALHGQVGPVFTAAVLRELAAAQGGSADRAAPSAPAPSVTGTVRTGRFCSMKIDQISGPHCIDQDLP